LKGSSEFEHKQARHRFWGEQFVKLPRLRVPPKSDHAPKEDIASSAHVPDKPKDAKALAADKAKSDAKDRSETVQLSKATKPSLYIYCIVPSTAPKDYGSIGVAGDAPVRTIEYKDIAAVVSEIGKDRFEKSDANILAHQRVVQKVFGKQLGIPVQFGTIVATNDDVERYLEAGSADFKKKLEELKPEAGPTIDAASPTDIIAQIISQSATSAVKIRQMTDILEDLRRKQYDKGAERMPEGAAKQLLEFLAKAPPGSYETSETRTTSATEQAQEIQRRLDALFEAMTDLRKLSNQVNSEGLETLRNEQQKIREAVGDLRNLYNENAASIGFQLGIVVNNFDKLTTSLKENTASIEKTVKQTIVDTIPHSIEEAMKSIRPVRWGRARPREELSAHYTWCISCRAEIRITDRFCDSCGWPVALTTVL
jgi:hypothetical protein